MTREEAIKRLRAEAEAVEARRRKLSEELAAELSTFHPRDILHVFFSYGAARDTDAQKARIAALEKQTVLCASRLAALEAGRCALSYLDAIEANVREMEWNGTGRYGRQSFGRMEQQRHALENTEALLPILNLFFAGFAQLTGETADIPTLLDRYFEGLFVASGYLTAPTMPIGPSPSAGSGSRRTWKSFCPYNRFGTGGRADARPPLSLPKNFVFQQRGLGLRASRSKASGK